METCDIAIIGGGAAGFFAALAAAEQRASLRILILEKGTQPLAKVRISGGGRCNVTYACFDPAELVLYYPRGEQELRGAFARFQPKDMLTWLAAHGVPTYIQADGRVFPRSDDSQSVIDCFINEARRLGISWLTHCGVNALKAEAGFFTLSLANGDICRAKRVLLAGGGGSASAYRLAAGLGHTIVPPVPSLFTFAIRDARLEGLMGISTPEVDLVLKVPWQGREKKLTASGPLLITHWGLSGPAVLRLSAWGARLLAESSYQARLQVNWLPQFNGEQYFDELDRVKANQSRQPAIASEPAGRLPRRLWQALAAAAGIMESQAWVDIPKVGLRRLAEQVTRSAFEIQGKGLFKEEFVTCGGVSLKEVDFRTMQSRTIPGLFFAGEILDIDGLTGGFNFQAAWTTAWLAGRAMAVELET